MENVPDSTSALHHVDMGGPAHSEAPRPHESGRAQDTPTSKPPNQGSTSPARIIEFPPAQIVVLTPQVRADQEAAANQRSATAAEAHASGQGERALATAPHLAPQSPDLGTTDRPSPDPGIRASANSSTNSRPDKFDKERVDITVPPSNAVRPGRIEPETANTKSAPILTGSAYAGAAGLTGGLLDFLASLADTLGSLGFGYMGESETANAVQEFRTLGETASLSAMNEDEVVGTASSAVGFFGPEAFSPSSKVKVADVAVKSGKALVLPVTRKMLLKKLAEKLKKNSAYKKMKKRGLTEKPISASRGSWFQRWLSGKDYEYVAKLKRPVDGTSTVQIDDLVVAANNKVTLVEAKFMGEYVGIVESGHFRFGDEKIGHLKRLVQYFEENRDVVSHIEIAASREEAAQIYAEIIARVPSLKAYLDSGVITFSVP